MAAGTTSPLAGASAPFGLSIVRPDGQAALNGVRMELPPGLLANLKGNLGTQVGTATAHAGLGTAPLSLPGKVFLEAPTATRRSRSRSSSRRSPGRTTWARSSCASGSTSTRTTRT